MKRRVVIMGAAGRDFHNFNVFFRDNEEYEVVAFTATQIPGIDDKKYPAELAGRLYPDGIKIYSESELPELIKNLNVEIGKKDAYILELEDTITKLQEEKTKETVLTKQERKDFKKEVFFQQLLLQIKALELSNSKCKKDNEQLIIRMHQPK